MSKEKIGVGIITCNRPDYLKGLLNSLQSCRETIDELVIVNDGEPLVGVDVDKIKGYLLQNKTNLGVAKSKNEALKHLIKAGCEYFFLIEDDMLIKEATVFQQYVDACKASGIQHFNYGPGSPFNRKQTIKDYDLHNRHLLDEKSEPNPKLIVGYKNNINVALYEHTVAMFSFFTKKALQVVGGFPEEYDRCWEHVDHTYQIIKAGFHPPFWWFADLANSQELIEEAPGAIEKSSIAKDKNEWMQRVMEGREIYKQKHGHYPNQPPLHNQEEVLESLKQIANYANI